MEEGEGTLLFRPACATFNPPLKSGNGTALQKINFFASHPFLPLPLLLLGSQAKKELCCRRGQSLAKGKGDGGGDLVRAIFFPAPLSDGNAKFQRKLSRRPPPGSREGGREGSQETEEGEEEHTFSPIHPPPPLLSTPTDDPRIAQGAKGIKKRRGRGEGSTPA